MYVNLDQVILKYSADFVNEGRRLQTYMEMRLLAEDTVVDPANNVVRLDDSVTLLSDAEIQLQNSIARALQLSSTDLFLEYEETATGVLNSAG